MLGDYCAKSFEKAWYIVQSCLYRLYGSGLASTFWVHLLLFHMHILSTSVLAIWQTLIILDSLRLYLHPWLDISPCYSRGSILWLRLIALTVICASTATTKIDSILIWWTCYTPWHVCVLTSPYWWSSRHQSFFFGLLLLDGFLPLLQTRFEFIHEIKTPIF